MDPVTSVPRPVLPLLSNLRKADEGLRWAKYGFPVLPFSGNILAIVRPLSVTRISPWTETLRINSSVLACNSWIDTFFMILDVTCKILRVNGPILQLLINENTRLAPQSLPAASSRVWHPHHPPSLFLPVQLNSGRIGVAPMKVPE